MERWLLHELAKLQAERLHRLFPLVHEALVHHHPSIVVPGQAEHDNLIKRYSSAVWAAGYQQGQAEVATHDIHRIHSLHTFSDPPGPPPLLPKNAIDWANNRVALQGQWQRSLDGAVTAILVNALETGANLQDTMRALERIFPTFSKSRLENIARTESVAAYNQGRLAAFRANPYVSAVQFSAILDNRTTDICRDRDGLIMALTDPRLLGNTPPLHFQCRSTLVPITRYQWLALQDEDKATEKEFFGWVKGEQAPRTLEEATMAWDRAPAPLPGFGTPADVKSPKNSKPTGKAAAKPTPPTPTVVPLKKRLDDEITRGGTIPVADITHLDLTRGGKLIMDEVESLVDWSKLTGTRKEKEAIWSEAVKSVIEDIRSLGPTKSITFEAGSTQTGKQLIADVLKMLPTEWGDGLADLSAHKNMKVTTLTSPKARSYMSPTGDRLALMKDDTPTALHEVGHWLEYIGYTYGYSSRSGVGPERLSGLAQDFLDFRRQGFPLELLSKLTGDSGYRANERAWKDHFTVSYIGKNYHGTASEITSMGLQGIYYNRYDIWDKDQDMAAFILGMLAWI